MQYKLFLQVGSVYSEINSLYPDHVTNYQTFHTRIIFSYDSDTRDYRTNQSSVLINLAFSEMRARDSSCNRRYFSSSNYRTALGHEEYTVKGHRPWRRDGVLEIRISIW